MTSIKPDMRLKTYRLDHTDRSDANAVVAVSVSFWQFGNEPVNLLVRPSAVIRDTLQRFELKPKRELLFFISCMPVDVMCEVRRQFEYDLYRALARH